MYIQLLRGEWTSAHSRGVRLHDPNHMADHFRWNPKPSAHTSDCGRRRSYEWIGPEIEVKHEGVGPFDKHILSFR
jgi:hypothetical protein